MKHYQSTAFSILFALLVSSSPAFSQAGSSGMAFLKLGVSGKGVAMGDAMSAIITGAAATYYNPAGIVFNSDNSAQLLLMHKEWIQDVRSEFLGTSLQLTDNSAFGLSLNTATVSDIEIRTRPGAAEGTFTSRDFSLGLSYARRFGDNLNIGITGKYLFEKIFVDQASGYAIDLGAQYKTPIDNLNVGLALANLGSTQDLRSQSIKLPSLLRAGPAYTLPFEEMKSSLTVAGDVLYIFPEKNTYLNLGGEFMFDNVVGLRVGYQFGSQGRGFTTGLGLQYGMFNLDYGFVPLSSDLGSGHTFSLVLNL